MNNVRFSDEDVAAIRRAVEAAEARTRAEIVPMVVPASGRYRDAGHLAGLILALAVLTASATLEYEWGPHEWTAVHPGWIVVAAVVAYAAGHVAGLFPWCVRLLTSDERMAMKVRRRAELAFYEHGLHKTRDATGILILLSVLERRAQILADRAIDARVPPRTWETLIETMIQDIKHDRPTQAFCRVITECGDLLAVHFSLQGPDNPNELKDDLIQER